MTSICCCIFSISSEYVEYCSVLCVNESVSSGFVEINVRKNNLTLTLLLTRAYDVETKPDLNCPLTDAIKMYF